MPVRTIVNAASTSNIDGTPFGGADNQVIDTRPDPGITDDATDSALVNGSTTTTKKITGTAGTAGAAVAQHTASGAAGDILNYARQFLGTPYKWGGTTPLGFDCSGFVQYVYKQYGVNLPRVSYQQAAAGAPVSAAAAQAGDLVYYKGKNGTVDHIGIYMGGGYFIEAPHTGDVIKIAKVGNAAGYTRVLPSTTSGSARRSM